MKILLCLCLTSLYSLSVLAEDNFSIYLVRHAEKQMDQKNPSLTSCGFKRAEQLATMLHHVNLQAVYSTSYQRTLFTAKPTAKDQHLPVKHYSPKGLEQLAVHLKQQAQNALVVGHSNTTPILAALLLEKPQTKEKIPSIAENEYQLLYQIQFNENHPHVTIFRQPLKCKTSQ